MLLRDHLAKLVSLMGGKWSESFSRRNTHLLAETNEGTKVDKAKEWGIPVLKRSWFDACVDVGRMVPIHNHMVSAKEPPKKFDTSAFLADLSFGILIVVRLIADRCADARYQIGLCQAPSENAKFSQKGSVEDASTDNGDANVAKQI